MKRLALLLPLLALAVAPARAEDPATRSPVAGKSHAESAEAATNGVKSPIAMRVVMASRTPGERGKDLAYYGSAGGDATVMRALRWLKTVQCEDGSWPGHPVASTALALWCYFDHNETPLDADEPEFARTTFRGLRFLAGDLDPETGLFRSARGEPLAQPLGALALAMGYETTFSVLHEVSLRPLLRDAAESALRPILAGQRPDGAWNVDPLDPSPDGRGDPRATVWCTLALRGGRIWTHDFASTPEWQRRAGDALAAFLDPAADAALRPDGAATPVTAAAVVGLQRLGRHNDPAARRGIDALVGCVYSWEAWDGPQPWGGSGAPVRDWAFVTSARFVCGGRTFGEWNKQFFPEACGRQLVVPADESGYRDLSGKLRPIGWWDSPSETEAELCSGGPVLPCKRWRGGECLDGETTLGDRVRDTCFEALSLMTYYAFLPSRVLDEHEALSSPVAVPHPKTNNATVRVQIRRKSPATNAPAAPASHAPSADGAKEPVP